MHRYELGTYKDGAIQYRQSGKFAVSRIIKRGVEGMDVIERLKIFLITNWWVLLSQVLIVLLIIIALISIVAFYYVIALLAAFSLVVIPIMIQAWWEMRKLPAPPKGAK
jgi:ABC-type transport system involved in Fe-S cluster assembly fused permease/ATPase subunit